MAHFSLLDEDAKEGLIKNNENISLKLKSPHTAENLALYPTLIGGGLFLITVYILIPIAIAESFQGLDAEDKDSFEGKFEKPAIISFFTSVGILGIGPSLGHFYTEDYLIAFGGIAARAGIFSATVLAGNSFGGDLYMLMTAGMFLFGLSIGYQVSDTRESALRYNKWITAEKRISYNLAPTFSSKNSHGIAFNVVVTF